MNYRKIMVAALLILLAVIFITKVAPWAGDPANHTHSIEQTDEKIQSVIALSGGAAATSATLSILPGDACTPLAEELAELTKYFLLILSALYLEKLLISLSGYISFSFLIPAACLMLCGAVLTGRKAFGRNALKIAAVALIIFAIVPASVKISDMVYQTQANQVNETINEYNELDLTEESGGFLSELTTLTTGTVDKVTSFVDNLLESLAVMIVTSCLIPILVVVFLVWMVKVIFSANVLTLDPGTVDAIAARLGMKEKK